jgi:hypothetical protein
MSDVRSLTSGSLFYPYSDIVGLTWAFFTTSTYAPLGLTLPIDAPRDRLQPTALRFFVWFGTKAKVDARKTCQAEKAAGA